MVNIRRAFVAGEMKCTKTKAGTRTILLLPLALTALNNQRKHTGASGSEVFSNPVSNKRWETSDHIRRVWRTILKRACVRYRNPYQTRHTYASMLLSGGENIMWVATQMGHVDTEMVMRTYGKWIPDANSQQGYTPDSKWGGILS